MPNSNDSLLRRLSGTDPQFYCLLAALGIEFCLMAFGGYGLYVLDNFAIMPCMVFLGTALTRKLSPRAKKLLLFGVAVAVWFCFTQAIHYAQDLKVRSPGLPFPIYLMALPFAAVSGDSEKQYGLKLAGLVYIAAGLFLTGLTGLLILNVLPGFLTPHVYWDGARLQAMWHPNICASIFMIGIAFCLVFCSLSRKSWQKELWLAIAALLFGAMALTNSRTSILMTCALAGGFAFFAILRKGGWKRFLAGAAAALVLMAALFLISDKVFDAHSQRLAQAMQLAAAPAEEAAEAVPAAEVTPGLTADAIQGDLSSDLRTLNGRTGIWSAAMEALRNDPRLLVWGTDYSGWVIVPFHPYETEIAHAHNSWLEILMCLGIPGLLAALLITALALWRIAATLLSRKATLWHKALALLLICLLGAGFLEPYLFLSDRYYHYTDFIFMLGLGYLDDLTAH